MLRDSHTVLGAPRARAAQSPVNGSNIAELGTWTFDEGSKNHEVTSEPSPQRVGLELGTDGLLQTTLALGGSKAGRTELGDPAEQGTKRPTFLLDAT